MDLPVRRTKIIATLGPATDAPGMLQRILEEGVDVVRLNLSHGAAEDHQRRIDEVRAAAAALGREVAVLADLQGPKIRIAKFAAAPVLLDPGQRFALECDPNVLPGDVTRIGVSYLNLYKDVKVGDTLLLDDGLIALKVDSIEGTTIRTTVEIGGAGRQGQGRHSPGGKAGRGFPRGVVRQERGRHGRKPPAHARRGR